MGPFATILFVLFSTALDSRRNQQPAKKHGLVHHAAVTPAAEEDDTVSSSSSSSLSSPPPILTLRAAPRARRFDAVIVDVENVRGRSGFALSHAQVLEALRLWNTNNYKNNENNSSGYCCHGKLTLAVDHGAEASRYWLPDAGYAVVFAGPRTKADDTIASDLVPYFVRQLQLERILVVTADAELVQRCLRAANRGGGKVEILSPDSLLSDLEKILEAYPLDLPGNDDEGDVASDEPSGLVDEYELKLGGDLLEIEAQLRQRAGMNNKRRKRLRFKGQGLWQKLEALSPSMLERVVDVLRWGRHCESVRELSLSERAVFLTKWEKTQRTRRRKEKTQDRIVLAENLRLELQDKYGSFDANAAAVENSSMGCAKAYVYHQNIPPRPASMASQSPEAPSLTLQSAPTVVQKSGPLQLVVISDTHGFEDQLTADANGKLPDADVLLHLGDFAVDRCPDMMERLRKFDAWLATAASHIPTKIILRGNHDCRAYDFALSGATYITQAKGQEIAGYKFAFIPYLSGGLRRKSSLPKSCDVLVSHVPPYRILDRCLTGKNAGSKTLLKGAQGMTAGPPFLWLCGHIHEARGVVRNTVFCLNQDTTVINAANANSGIASRLDYGPVVLQLGDEGMDLSRNIKERRQIEICEMDGQYVYLNQKNPAFFQRKTEDQQFRQLLLSVDLGLRTGVSMYDDKGRLRRYENFQLESAEELQKMAETLLEEWEREANKQSNLLKSDEGTENHWKVTHIAIEGGDPPLAEAWRSAANGQRCLLYVKPEEWRSDLLTKEEMLSGESSKAASRARAQQIVTQYGDAPMTNLQQSSDFQTDMAESVLLGLHVTRRLGWGELRDPLIRSTIPASFLKASERNRSFPSFDCVDSYHTSRTKDVNTNHKTENR